MSALRLIRIAAWVAVLALAAVAGFAFLGVRPGGLDPTGLPFAAQVGGPFTLTSHEGKRFTDADLKGQPFALFFGFTNCPDICPTTLLGDHQSPHRTRPRRRQAARSSSSPSIPSATHPSS